MFCKNCGKTLKETDKFCAKCGTPVEVSATESPMYNEVDFTPTQEVLPDTEEVVSNKTAILRPEDAPTAMNQVVGGTENYGYQMPQQPQKKKSPVGKIIAAVAAVAVVGSVSVVAVNASAINNFTKKAFSSPVSYLQYVEEKQAKETASTIAGMYGNYLDAYKAKGENSVSGEVTVELGDQARRMLATYSPVDLSFLEKTSLKYESGYQDNVLGFNLDMLIGEKPVITLDTLFDMNGNMAYFMIPELSNQYLSTSISTSSGDVSTTMNQLSGMADSMLEEALIEKLYTDYYTTAISCIDDVKKSNGTIEAGGVSQKCTVLTATIDSEAAQKMSEKVLTKLKSDKNVEDLIKDCANVANAMEDGSADAEAMYQDFLQYVDGELSSVESISMDENITMTIWVDGKGDILGRSFNASGMETKYIMPGKGKNYGFEASVTGDSTNYVIEGNGKITGGILSGDFKIASNGTEYANLEVKDYDVKKMKDGYLNGTFTVSMTPESSTELTGTSLVANYDLQIACTSSKDSSKVKISVLSLDQLLGAITITSNMNGKLDTTLPSADAVVSTEDQAALFTWITSIDWAGFTTRLRDAGVPSELVDQIESATSALSMYGY